MKKIFALLFQNNFVASALLYTGLALILLAVVPSQASVQALYDNCNGACEEGMVCVGDDENGYHCQCAVEE